MLGPQVVVRLGQQEMPEGPEEGGGNVRGALILLCSSGWSCKGAAMGETTSGHQKMALHIVLEALPCFTVPACVSAAPAGAVAWLLHQRFSGHVPERLMIHSFRIPGSSQVQQLLWLPRLLNKVGSGEKEICQYCFSAGTVCGILSGSSPSSKPPFCVACLWKLRLCPCIS